MADSRDDERLKALENKTARLSVVLLVATGCCVWLVFCIDAAAKGGGGERFARAACERASH